MKRLAIVVLLVLEGTFAAARAGAEDANPPTPANNESAATTQPDIQALRDRAMDSQVALDRARADCLRQLAQNDDYKAAVADLATAQGILDQASDSESRANAAAGRMAAKKHLEDLKTAALASDAAVKAAIAAQKQASDSYQAAMMQNSAATTLSHANAGTADPDAAAVKEMMDRGEKERLEAIKSMLADIRELDDQLGQIPEDNAHQPHRDEISQKIVKDRQMIARAQKLKGHYLPVLTQEIGSTGAILESVKVFQVIDHGNMIITTDGDSLFWVKGVDTTKFVDNEEIEFYRPMRVSGTTQYNSVGGSTRTILMIEPFTAANDQ